MEGLKLYSDVKSEPIQWLWYPYIPKGKITLLQGDPGDGKSTLVMQLISILTNTGQMPNGHRINDPCNVIYQCSEDGVSDTIKPRLEKSKANCRRVAFIDEELTSISLDDERLSDAIEDFNASLLVIDPFQAYLGEDMDLGNMKKIRKVMRRLSYWATKYNCAILLIGHMTKKESSKDLYRGVGSIDFVAAARSVLQLYKAGEDSPIRYLRQVKNSLAPKGYDIGFQVSSEEGFKWISGNKLRASNPVASGNVNLTQDELIVDQIIKMISDGHSKATEIQKYFNEHGVGEKTLKRIKKKAGIRSVRKSGQWYWEIDSLSVK